MLTLFSSPVLLHTYTVPVCLIFGTVSLHPLINIFTLVIIITVLTTNVLFSSLFSCYDGSQALPSIFSTWTSSLYVIMQYSVLLHKFWCNFSFNFLPMPVAQSLSLHPTSLRRPEGDPKVTFFCREDDDTFATDIVWVDPQENTYIPGSTSEGGNARISARGSSLSISNISRMDAGAYRCVRESNHTEFANGTLHVLGMYIIDCIH